MRPTQRPPADEPVDLSDAQAPDFIEAHRVVVLAFLAQGDTASARLLERLRVLAARLAQPGLAFGLIDVDRDPLVAQALQLDKAPATFLFMEGEMVDRIVGSPPLEILEETLQSRLRAP